MKPPLFLFFILCLFFSATQYIDFSTPLRLKGKPVYWNDDNIYTSNAMLTLVKLFSIFLGGFLAAFIIPVYVLLTACCVCLLGAIGIFEGIFRNRGNNATTPSDFISGNYVWPMVIFFVLFAIYSGLSKFILLVMMLDQKYFTNTEHTMMFYLISLNLSTLVVYGFFPTNGRYGYCLTFSLPLIIIAIVLLILGRWKNLYQMDSTQLRIGSIIYNCFNKKKEYNYSLFCNNAGDNFYRSESQLSSTEETLLSFSKLCIIFIILIPYAICKSQLRTTFLIQSNHLLQPQTDYYANKEGFWLVITNSLGVIIFIPIILVLRKYSRGFRKIYSKTIWRVIASNFLIFLSILSAGIVETVRLKVYSGSSKSTERSSITKIQTIGNTNYCAADMSVFYMTPQLLFLSISEILMITTCGSFLYQQSVGSMRYLAISFFLGAIGSGGAGDAITLLSKFILSDRLCEPFNHNNRTFNNETSSVESRMDCWFYGLAGVFFITIILTSVILMKFKHYYHSETENEPLLSGMSFSCH